MASQKSQSTLSQNAGRSKQHGSPHRSEERRSHAKSNRTPNPSPSELPDAASTSKPPKKLLRADTTGRKERFPRPEARLTKAGWPRISVSRASRSAPSGHRLEGKKAARVWPGGEDESLAGRRRQRSPRRWHRGRKRGIGWNELSQTRTIWRAV